REWFDKAAAKDKADAMVEPGVIDAMAELGVLYMDGLGVTQDYAKARDWYEKAAAKDNALAMVNLGLFYENGRGVTQDYAKARDWYEKAATQGHEIASTALEHLQIFEAEATGRYSEALRLAEAFAK